MYRKNTLIMVLVLFTLLLTSTSAMANDRFDVTGWSADYGLKTFWFRFAHFYNKVYEGEEVIISRQEIQCYKIPDDNIYPPNVGNGSAILHRTELVNSSNNDIVDSLSSFSYPGTYYSVIVPGGTIWFFKKCSNYNEIMSGSENYSYLIKSHSTIWAPPDFLANKAVETSRSL